MRHSRIGLWGSGLALTMFALGAAPSAPGQPTTQVMGKAIFEGKGICFSCHGKDGKGTVLGPNLTDDEWLQFEERPTVEALAGMVTAGVPKPVKHPAPMPPMGGARLNDEELAALAAYVLGLSAGDGAGSPIQ